MFKNLFTKLKQLPESSMDLPPEKFVKEVCTSIQDEQDRKIMSKFLRSLPYETPDKKEDTPEE